MLKNASRLCFSAVKLIQLVLWPSHLFSFSVVNSLERILLALNYIGTMKYYKAKI